MIIMDLATLEEIIQRSGGKSFALDYADDLLTKINNVANNKVPNNYFKQFSQASNAGDLKGRILEINLANYFAIQKIPLSYAVKQRNVSGDIDLLWETSDTNVYIEVKLLGQETKISKQLMKSGISCYYVEDDTNDIMRLQYTIIDKATLKKFQYPPIPNSVNLIMIDVSELQLGNVDVGDCVLATLGSTKTKGYFGEVYERDSVLGLFELCSKKSQCEWAEIINTKLKGEPHPRHYIHGVIFLFREPKELAALSYDLKTFIAWNNNLITENLSHAINTEFHKIIPFYFET
jgi:hypothetical protein